jgi:hypothetical protein
MPSSTRPWCKAESRSASFSVVLPEPGGAVTRTSAQLFEHRGPPGVAPGTIAGDAEFRVRFAARWQDEALDDAASCYDAGAVAVLALARALAREGAIPQGKDLSPHIVAVTRAGQTPVAWNNLKDGLRRLRDGQEIEYVGVSGPLEFDDAGLSPAAKIKWWTIDGERFSDAVSHSNCQ